MPSLERVGFSARTRQERKARIIAVHGEVDVSTVPRLQPELEAALRAHGPVVIDLCGATFLDSAGLYALLVFRERLREQSRRMAVACWPQGAVAMALHVSGTDRVFGVHATLEDAIGDARNEPADWKETLVRAGEKALSLAAQRLRGR
jgi:anti-sigma B factor antagonist